MINHQPHCLFAVGEFLKEIQYQESNKNLLRNGGALPMQVKKQLIRILSIRIHLKMRKWSSINSDIHIFRSYMPWNLFCTLNPLWILWLSNKTNECWGKHGQIVNLDQLNTSIIRKKQHIGRLSILSFLVSTEMTTTKTNGFSVFRITSTSCGGKKWAKILSYHKKSVSLRRNKYK